MRMWPVLTTLTRICEKDYQFPDSDFKVEKEVKIIIPVLAMHRDSDFYPDPLKWDPERFSQESRSSLNYLPYFAFGDGPRICIGETILSRRYSSNTSCVYSRIDENIR